MKKIAIIISLLSCFALTYGQNNIIGIGGGLVKPLGDGSEYWKMGFDFKGEYFIKIYENILLGARIAYNHNTVDEDMIKGLFSNEVSQGYNIDVSATSSIMEILPSIRVVSCSNLENKVQFFGQVGGGFYLMGQKADVSVSNMGTPVGQASFGLKDNKLGFDFGAGLMLGGKIKFIVYPLYNIILTEGKSTKFLTINEGIVFCF
jgi:hypothetical protein